MTPLAGMLAESGYRVTGSDAGVYPPASTLLETLGIPWKNGFDAANLEPAPDIVVLGNALSRGNPEVEAVLDRKIPYRSLPQTLEEFFLPGHDSLIVTGTHGKTTTTSMLSWILHYAGRHPNFLIGGVAENFGRSFGLGGGNEFVLEGDEYDSAFFDKGPKFLHYHPQEAIITSLEFDHADIYENLAAIELQFRRMVNLVPRSGRIVAWGESPTVRGAVAKAYCPVETYGFTPGLDWLAGDLEITDGETLFRALTEDNPLPAIMGRVCYHPCETSCNRGKVDEPVGINSIERFLGDEALKRGWRFASPKTESGKRVLSSSAQGPRACPRRITFRRFGHYVKIVEAGPLAGGMMRFGIPKYRLPRDVLDGEVQRILEMGVELELNSKVTNVVETMSAGHFDAAFLAVGAHIAKRAYIPAGEAAHMLDAVSVLRSMEGEEKPMLGRRRGGLWRRQHRARCSAHGQQYGWTLFVNPIDQKYHWGRAAIQVAFTIFVLTETWLVPFEGYLIDKFGPQAHGQRQRRRWSRSPG